MNTNAYKCIAMSSLCGRSMLREIITAEEEDSGQLDILKAWAGMSKLSKKLWIFLGSLPIPMFLSVFQVTRAHKRMQAVLLARSSAVKCIEKRTVEQVHRMEEKCHLFEHHCAFPIRGWRDAGKCSVLLNWQSVRDPELDRGR